MVSKTEFRDVAAKMERYGHILKSIYESVKLSKDFTEEQKIVLKHFFEYFEKHVPEDLVANQAVE